VLAGDPLPGQTPIDDISGLKIRGISTLGELSVEEGRNILKAAKRYLGKRITARSAPFTFGWMLDVHKQMFGDVWKWAGQLRTTDGLNFGQPCAMLSSLLHDLCQDLPTWREFDHPPFEQAARLHHRAVWIHPFLNGNGRWARMLANIWLRVNKHPHTDWPEQTMGANGPVRDEYLAAIRQADQGDLNALTAMHARYAHRSD